jgi:RimJ/RimL family protein N-acetyltransferase
MKAIPSPNETVAGVGFRIRAIEPADKNRLAEGFQRLSPQSRYRRFFSHKNTLTVEELQRLTEFDGDEHFALGAFELSPHGDDGDAVGVARFIRLPEDAETAELAIAVVDDRQGRGIGRLLLQRLLAVAHERGVKRIRCYVLAENERMRRLAEGMLGKAASIRREGEILIADFLIPEPVPDTRAVSVPQGLFDLFRLAARGSILMPAIVTLTTMEQRLKSVERSLDVLNQTLQSGRLFDPLHPALPDRSFPNSSGRSDPTEPGSIGGS